MTRHEYPLLSDYGHLNDDQRELLVAAMAAHGITDFWCQLVFDDGPRGRAVAGKLWRTRPWR